MENIMKIHNATIVMKNVWHAQVQLPIVMHVLMAISAMQVHALKNVLKVHIYQVVLVSDVISLANNAKVAQLDAQYVLMDT